MSVFAARYQFHGTGMGIYWPTEAHVWLVQKHGWSQESDTYGARVLREQKYDAQNAVRYGRQEKRRYERGAYITFFVYYYYSRIYVINIIHIKIYDVYIITS